MDHLFPYPKMGHSFTEILLDPLTRKVLGHDAVHAEKTPFIRGVTSRLAFLLNDPVKHLSFLKVGYTSLEAFLQANVTGPPLDFDSEPVVFPETYRDGNFDALKKEIFEDLSVDGAAVYALTPRIELFWLAKVVMSNLTTAEAGFNGRRARFRVNFWHQKLLQEKSDTLQDQLYTDADVLEDQLSKRLGMKAAASEEHFVEFLLERAAVRTYYGDAIKAREDLARAASIRDFQFALTGALGKRTKFQDRDISQLVLLARSRDFEPEPYNSRKSSRADPSSRKSSNAEARSPKIPHRPATPTSSTAAESIEAVSPSMRKISVPEVSVTQPEDLPLNDDTLHERIQFTHKSTTEAELTQVKDSSKLPSDLVNLNPGTQPILFPVDSIILLSIASSITNTSPADGLTREETLPYAIRALDGGSSNWQVYTQALLIRSRIEGYRSRTAERGLLQLQALVDQVIQETAGTKVITKKGDEADEQASKPTTFLPKLEPSESATVAERLKYIYQLSPPLRWELEAELAQRWTSIGGLRTALEIYERLQMHAEVALCLAATDQEAEAVKLLKSLLFEDPSVPINSAPKLKAPQPSDAARLLAILGDIEQEPEYYVMSWTASNKRYARAQRSLGRYHTKKRNIEAATEAYKLAISVTRLDGSTWFALGCLQLEQADYVGAVESFTRVVQLEDRDAEGWSNLAVALLRLPPPTEAPAPESLEASVSLDDEDEEDAIAIPPNPYQHTEEALRALRRASNLKREDARIWDNYLTVAASIPPSRGTPWNEVILAMEQVIALRSPKQGEASVDLKILSAIVDHITQTVEYPSNDEDDDKAEQDLTSAPAQANTNAASNSSATEPDPESETQPQPPTTTTTVLPFTARSFLRMIDNQITPLVTSAPLFTILARLALWRHRPAESLSYTEKAWRAATSQPGAYDSTEAQWNEVVGATVRLVDAYRQLGDLQREKTAGLVEKGWKFKARTAVRGVLGRGKDAWEGTEGYVQLEEVGEGLKG